MNNSDELLRKLKETKIKKSRKLMQMMNNHGSFKKEMEEKQNVPEIDEKEQTEREVHYKIPEFIWKVLCELDAKYIPMDQLKIRCHDRGLSISGGKKELIWRLLNDEIFKEKAESSYIMVRKAAQELDGINLEDDLKILCKARGLSTGNRGKKELGLELLRFEFTHKIPIL